MAKEFSKETLRRERDVLNATLWYLETYIEQMNKEKGVIEERIEDIDKLLSLN